MLERVLDAARCRQYGKLFLFSELAFNNKNMQDSANGENKGQWYLRKMSPKDYGKTAIICLLLVGIKGALFESAGLFLDLLVNILAIVSMIAGVLWIKEKIKSKNKKS